MEVKGEEGEAEPVLVEVEGFPPLPGAGASCLVEAAPLLAEGTAPLVGAVQVAGSALEEGAAVVGRAAVGGGSSGGGPVAGEWGSSKGSVA